MSTDTAEKTIRMTSMREDYAHTQFKGTYEDPVTEQDIREKYAHPVFGGRMIAFGGGKFEFYRHND